MRRINGATVGGVVLLVCVSWMGLFSFPAWQFNHLERRAKKVATGAALQIWATNLLNSYPPTNTWFTLDRSEFGTNFPPQLLSLSPRLGPNVAVYLLDDQPRSVRLFWSSGPLGSSGFEIGSTDFVGRGNKWQDGVYFFRRR